MIKAFWFVAVSIMAFIESLALIGLWDERTNKNSVSSKTEETKRAPKRIIKYTVKCRYCQSEFKHTVKGYLLRKDRDVDCPACHSTICIGQDEIVSDTQPDESLPTMTNREVLRTLPNEDIEDYLFKNFSRLGATWEEWLNGRGNSNYKREQK